MKYSIVLSFRTKERIVLYEGESFVKKGLTDHILIRKDKIKLDISRSKKVNIDTLFSGPKSNLRLQFQKALCFYLAVCGEIPNVKSFEFSDEKGNIKPIATLPGGLKNCRIAETLPIDAISDIFTELPYHLELYVTLSYFLKAQLISFTSDSFRYAWSGFNSIYSFNMTNARESAQLKHFAEEFNSDNYKSSLTYIKGLDEQFWKSLNYYKFVQTKENRKNNSIFSECIDCYTDTLINEYLVGSYCGYCSKLQNAEKKKKAEQTAKNYRNKLKNRKKCSDMSDRFKFLAINYCYMQRNRQFHGAKIYPVFTFCTEEVKQEERILADFLILVIKDFIVSKGFKKGGKE